MRAFSFIHCSDLHLGAPFKGLDSLPTALAERLRDAPAAAFRRIVDAAIDRQVAAVLIAGDLFDASERNLYAQVCLRDQLRRLDEAGTQALLVAGNHDPLGSRSTALELPSSAHLFGEHPEGVPIEVGNEVVAHVYGASYPRAAERGNLAARFPTAPDGPFSIALLHTNLGDRPGHGRYAPCSLADLRQRGFDYWALGHVHTRETVQAERPMIHYPGNVQGLHSGENGARGATLVEVSASGKPSARPVWTDLVRWHRVRTPIDEILAVEELIGAFAEIAGTLRGDSADRSHLVRWTLAGHGPLHTELRRSGTVDELLETLRDIEGDASKGSPVWLQRVDLSTRPLHDLEGLRAQQDYLGDILRIADAIRDRPPDPATTGEASTVTASAHKEITAALGAMLDQPRLARALGEDPWKLLPWKNVVACAEAIALEKLAPGEED